MKMIDHNHFICHLILGTFTEYPEVQQEYSILAVHAYTVKVIVGLLLLYFLKVNIFTFIAVENLFPA